MNQQFQLYQDDCEKVLPTLPDASIDLIVEDGPYHKVKGEDWDNRHKTVDEFIAWKRTILEQYQRILKPNGSLYVFASPQMAWHVEGVVRERFNMLNTIDWIKDEGWHKKSDEESLRCYFPQKETIIFAEQFNSDNVALGESGYERKCDQLRGFIFEPLRAYLRGEFDRAGIHTSSANDFCGTASMATRHYFTQSQWCLPTAEHYASLQRGLNAKCNGHGPEYLKRDYEDLKRDYEDLRRPFNATPDAPYTDVWTFPTVMSYAGKHPCEKPLSLLEHIVRLSSKTGAVVLDCFMGSGATGHACINLERKFVGVEQSTQWFDAALRRIVDAERIRQRQPKQLVGKDSDYADAPLFAGMGDAKTKTA
jgi:adenine-specific DNA-methyltransferase